MTAAHAFRAAAGEHTETREPRIRLIPFGDIRLGTTRRDLVKGLIPRVGLTVAWGPPKCGKSFWASDLSMHVSLNWDYRERRVHSGPVVYCAFEGQTGIAARVEAFRLRFLAEDHEPPPFYLEPVTLDLVADHVELIAAIKRQLGDTAPVLVVLDTLNRSLRGSESSDQDMSAYVKAADAIREAFECAILIVHHCGINGERPRGHTSLTGAADAQLSVKRDAANNIIVTVEYMKDGPEGGTVASALDVVDVGLDEDGEVITSCVVVPAGACATTGRKTVITGSARLALDLLAEALADQGETSGTNGHVPPGVKTVPESVWRNYCYKGTVTDSDDPDSKRKAFNRAAKKLQDIKAIGVWNDRVWIAQ